MTNMFAVLGEPNTLCRDGLLNRFLNVLLNVEYGCTKVFLGDQHVRRIERTEHFVPGRSLESF